jgi:uncharacterized protein YjbI with pentapeptide repeats
MERLTSTHFTGHFAGKNLQGRSFRQQNLAGVDFSGADIRSADFTGASLVGATFQGAIAGLRTKAAISLIGIGLVLSSLFTFISVFAIAFTGYVLFPYEVPRHQPSTIAGATLTLILFGLFSVIVSRRKLQEVLLILLGVSSILGAVMGIFAECLEAIVCGVITTALTTLLGCFTTLGIAAFIATASLVLNRIAVLIILCGILLSGTLGGSFASLVGMAVRYAMVTYNFRMFLAAGAAPKVLTLNDFLGASSAQGLLITSATGVLVVLPIALYIAWQALRGCDRLTWIKALAIGYSSIGGTQFRGADLTQVDLSRAVLKQTDFRGAKLQQTNFHLAKNLDLARVGHSILADRRVLDLLVSHRGSHQSYAGRILKGAYLAGADLRGADFTDAELSHAALVGAQLEGANLTRSQAIGTQFQQSRMTAACLESWNIDSTTQLEGIHCDYIYLLNLRQERRPSDGIFRSGEFAQLFREVINTIDLIFNNGIDWKAFSFSFQQLQIDYADQDLMVRSVENKGEGMTVIKLAVDPKADKQRIQASFTHQYQFALQVLEEKYRAELNSKDEQITLYRQHQADLQTLTQVLARQSTEPLAYQPGKLVLLKIGQGDFTSGFPVTLQISVDGLLPSTEQVGTLPPAPSLLLRYHEWRSAYRQCLSSCRIKVTDTQITNVSRIHFLMKCNTSAAILQQQFNQWLNTEEFRPIKEQMLTKLDLLEPIRIVVQTDDAPLQRMPWSTWELCDRYPTAEVALAQSCYEFQSPLLRQASKLKVLAILGDSTGINVQQDRQYLENLAHAEVTFLVEPERSQVNDQLWAQPWDILFFAGHSSSAQETGVIHLNASDSLSLSQLRYGLRQAIRNGLELAIFNSCDGLGLAKELADLQLPQMIVMREPVPDRVAHVFLRSLLKEYASPLPFYQKVRSAREQLQGLEKEFPCATWLPVIYQNPAALFEPRSVPL